MNNYAIGCSSRVGQERIAGITSLQNRELSFIEGSSFRSAKSGKMGIMRLKGYLYEDK